MRIADTSAIYAFLNQQDEQHAAARRAFEDPDTIIIPGEVLGETLGLIQRRRGVDSARQAGEYLWSQANTEIQPTDTGLLMAAWGEFLADRDGLTYPDCIVLAWCREHEVDALTFDRAMVRALRRN